MRPTRYFLPPPTTKYSIPPHNRRSHVVVDCFPHSHAWHTLFPRCQTNAPALNTFHAQTDRYAFGGWQIRINAVDYFLSAFKSSRRQGWTLGRRRFCFTTSMSAPPGPRVGGVNVDRSLLKRRRNIRVVLLRSQQNKGWLDPNCRRDRASWYLLCLVALVVVVVDVVRHRIRHHLWTLEVPKARKSFWERAKNGIRKELCFGELPVLKL